MGCELQHAVVADDDCVFTERVADGLRANGIQTSIARDSDGLWRRLAKLSSLLVVLEPTLPGSIWLSILRQTRAHASVLRLVVATAFPSVAMAQEAERVADVFLVKPVAVDEVLRVALSSDGGNATIHWQPPKLSQMSLARLEWEFVNRTLRKHDGNISLAARSLDIPRQTLYRKLRVYPPAR